MSIGMGITEQQSTDSVLVSNSCPRFVDLAVWFRIFLSLPCFSFCPQGVLPSANLWRKRLQLQRMKAFGSRESRSWEVGDADVQVGFEKGFGNSSRRSPLD